MVYILIVFLALIAVYYFSQASKVNRNRKENLREERREQRDEILRKTLESSKKQDNSPNSSGQEFNQD